MIATTRLEDDPLAEFLAEAGAVVAGAAALFGTCFYIAASALSDTEWGRERGVDPGRSAARGAQIGGSFGLAVVVFRAADL